MIPRHMHFHCNRVDSVFEPPTGESGGTVRPIPPIHGIGGGGDGAGWHVVAECLDTIDVDNLNEGRWGWGMVLK